MQGWRNRPMPAIRHLSIRFGAARHCGPSMQSRSIRSAALPVSGPSSQAVTGRQRFRSRPRSSEGLSMRPAVRVVQRACRKKRAKPTSPNHAQLNASGRTRIGSPARPDVRRISGSFARLCRTCRVPQLHSPRDRWGGALVSGAADDAGREGCAMPVRESPEPSGARGEAIAAPAESPWPPGAACP